MLKDVLRKNRTSRRLLSVVLCLIIAVSLVTVAIAAATVDIAVLGKAYTRAEIAAMPSAERSYTYSTSGGERTDAVRGVLLTELLKEVADDAVIDFQSVDNWSGMSSYSMTKSELVAGNAMISYERKDGDNWVDYVRETDEGVGYFALYIDGFRVAHAVNIISLAGHTAGPEESAPDSWIGDATPEEHDIRIVGLVEKPGYFTIEGLKTIAGDMTRTKEYNWLNSSNSRDTDIFTGVYFEDLLKNVIELSPSAAGMIVTASDGFSSSFYLNAGTRGVYWTDIDGNKMMLAWRGTASRTNRDIVDFELPRIALGQADTDDINRSNWVSDIVEIRITAYGDLRGYVWAAPAIEALTVAGITNGVGGNRFDPAGNMTRAMVVTLLGRSLKAEAPSNEDRRFTDVDYDSWYGGYIEWAVDKGYVQGYGNNKFGPDDFILLEHLLLLAGKMGLTDVPEGIDANAQRYATRAEAAVIINAVMAQGGA